MPIFRRKSRNPALVEKAVETIARATDCAVRRFESGQQPTPKEIADAVRQRKLEAPLTPEALPPGDGE